MLEKTPNSVSYSASINGGDALAVFSEIFYPKGWTATIDGKATEILRANYVLRALKIPDGQHEIVFTFKPKVYSIGNTLMLISSSIILIVFGIGIYVSTKENVTTPPEE